MTSVLDSDPGASIRDDFRADPESVYAFIAAFYGSLVAAGVEHLCLSPGSRSTPLSVGADRCDGLRTWVELDERSAGFFALGLAKQTRRPVALVCTSGTAAANYLPAVVEAHYSRVPLIVLTADRPPELRDWGVGQTIDQIGLYGSYTRWAVEMPVPPAGEPGLRYAVRVGARAAEQASGRPSGPVHLNWPLREPLAPPLENAARAGSAPIDETLRADPGLRFSRGRVVASEEDIAALVELVGRHRRGVVSCGPMDPDSDTRAAILGFAAASGWPVLADPISQLRGGLEDRKAPVLTMGDALARCAGLRERARPEVVLRLGESPVSKAQRLWLEESDPREVWWLDEGSNWGEPSHRATRVIRGGTRSLLEEAAARLRAAPPQDSGWSASLMTWDTHARRALSDFLDADIDIDAGADTQAGTRADSIGLDLSGIELASILSDAMPDDGLIFASNSMAIRFLDLAMASRPSALRVLCNRGANGIDGVTSSALGAAAARPGGKNVLLTGDLAFLHDLGGLLLTRQEEIDLVIVVLDDAGGGIFSFLPIASQGESVHYDRLFRTPHGLELTRAASLFELDHRQVRTRIEMEDALEVAFSKGGVSILHVPVEPSHNEARFRAALEAVEESLEESWVAGDQDGAT